MSFDQIVLKNLRRNVRHYGMYIFSLIVSIILYFSFVTLKYTDSINNENSTTFISKGSEIGSYFLFVIIVVFLMYANQLFIKRRTREFALYQLIGLTRFNILRMITIEQIAMFIATTFVGMIVGVFGSKILLMIVLKVLGINKSVSLTFQFPAVTQTCWLAVIAMVLILIQSFIFLRRRSILSMMNDSSKSEASKNYISIFEICAGILGIAMILLGYYLSTQMFDKFKDKFMPTSFTILFLTVVGAYLFFRSSVSVIFKTLKHSKRGKVSITDVVFTSSIMHKMKKNALSLTIIATISALTVTVLCFGAISKMTIDEDVKLTSPQDFNFSKKHQAEQFEKRIEKEHIGFNNKFKEVSEFKVTKDSFFKKEQGTTHSQPSTLPITSNKYIHDKAVKGSNAKIVNLVGSNASLKYNDEGAIQLSSQPKQSFNIKGATKNVYFSGDATLARPVMVVSADKYNQIKQDAKATQHQYGFDLKKQSDWKQANKIAKSIDPNTLPQKVAHKQMSDSVSVILFVTSFLGLAFLVAAGCIVYIKQMDETEDELPHFRILRKIGYTHQDMLKGLGLKIIFNFGLPLVISLMHAYFAAKAFISLLSGTTMLPIYIVMIIYSIIYAIFAIMAFVHSSRIVKHSI